jgi:hypothetical protein
VGDRDDGLHAELVGPAALALDDALSFLCIQVIKLILVLGLLSAVALGQGDLIVWPIVDSARTRPSPKKMIRGGHAVACFCTSQETPLSKHWLGALVSFVRGANRDIGA